MRMGDCPLRDTRLFLLGEELKVTSPLLSSLESLPEPGTPMNEVESPARPPFKFYEQFLSN